MLTVSVWGMVESLCLRHVLGQYLGHVDSQCLEHVDGQCLGYVDEVSEVC